MNRMTRKAVIGELRELKYSFERRYDKYPTCLEEAIDYIYRTPSWIPVSEGLPKIDMSYPHHEDYLVQYDSGDMDVASWSNVNRFWTDHVTEPYWNCVQFARVTAWMPLPEPYKEGQE